MAKGESFIEDSNESLEWQKTDVKDNTLQPEWNEEFEVEVEDPWNSKIWFLLRDKGRFTKDEDIGACFISLFNLKKEEPKTMWLDLTSGNYPDKNVGQLQIKIEAISEDGIY